MVRTSCLLRLVNMTCPSLYLFALQQYNTVLLCLCICKDIKVATRKSRKHQIAKKSRRPQNPQTPKQQQTTRRRECRECATGYVVVYGMVWCYVECTTCCCSYLVTCSWCLCICTQQHTTNILFSRMCYYVLPLISTCRECVHTVTLSTHVSTSTHDVCMHAYIHSLCSSVCTYLL